MAIPKILCKESKSVSCISVSQTDFDNFIAINFLIKSDLEPYPKKCEFWLSSKQAFKLAALIKQTAKLSINNTLSINAPLKRIDNE